MIPYPFRNFHTQCMSAKRGLPEITHDLRTLVVLIHRQTMKYFLLLRSQRGRWPMISLRSAPATTLGIISLAVAVALLSVASRPVLGQGRALGAGSLVLDDGAGNSITIQPPAGLGSSYVYILPTPPIGSTSAGFVDLGAAIGQTLFWTGSAWSPSNFLANTNAGIGLGFASVPAAFPFPVMLHTNFGPDFNGTLNLGDATHHFSTLYVDNIVGTTGFADVWTRSGATLAPTTSGDNVTTSGNISTTSFGSISSANGLTITGPFTANGGAGTSGQVLTINGAGNPVWTSPGALSTVTFANITNGTNTVAAMTVGGGASILAGGGRIEATALRGTGSTSDAVDLATAEVAGILPIANGGTGAATQNFVDLSSAQSIGGVKTFSSTIAGNISGTASNVTGTVAIANGGTGSATQNFVDLSSVQSIGGAKTFTSTIGGNISGTASNVTGVVAIANGGTGSATVAGANQFFANSGAGSAPAFRAIAVGDVPTLNQSTTGTAANVTGVVAIANGGSGQSTQQLSIDALTGSQSAGKYLRSDGTHATLASIQAADVPILNQSTTGTASNITGTVAIANGGTGTTTANAALNNLLPSQGGNNGKVLQTNGSNTSWVALGGTGTVTSIDVAGGTTGLTTSGGPITASGTITLAGTLDVANGGTGAGTAVDARANLDAAAMGANSDITAMTGLTTPLAASYGGTGVATASANTVFAGPTSGANAAPAFRALVAADLPAGAGQYIQNGTAQQSSADFNIAGGGTIGNGLTVTGTTVINGGTDNGSTTIGNVTNANRVDINTHGGAIGSGVYIQYGNGTETTGDTKIGNGHSQGIISIESGNSDVGVRINNSGAGSTSIGNHTGDVEIEGVPGIGGDGVLINASNASDGNTHIGNSAAAGSSTTIGVDPGAGAFTLNGLNTAAPGNFYVNDGTNNAVGTASALDVVTALGSFGTFINNSSSLQATASFNIDGSGRVGTTMTAGGNINTTGGAYQIGGSTVLADVGTGNLFVGVGAGGSNTSGSYNTASGANALAQTTSGAQNTALGYSALYTNETGTRNTALGYAADVSAAGLTNATAIGSGATVTGSNTIQLGNSSVTLVNSSGAVNSGTGYRVAGAATSGNYLRGNGTNFVSAALNMADATGTLPAGNGGTGLASYTAGDMLYASNASTLSKLSVGANPDGYVLTLTGGLPHWQAGGGGGSGWGLTGNAGTTYGTNFIGTSDGQNLLFKVNGQTAGMIEFSGTNNTGIGYQVLLNNTSGLANVAIGIAALRANTTGSFNTASGVEAIYSNTTGSNNTATGLTALAFNTTGSNNTAAGAGSLQNNTTGSYNTAFGFVADVSTNGLTNATAIGAMALVSADNSLVLGSINGVNSATADTKVGIGTSSPSTRLDVEATTLDNLGHLLVNRNNAGGLGGELTIGNRAGNNTAGTSAAIAFEIDGSTTFANDGSTLANAEIRALNTGGVGNATALLFSTWDGSAEGEWMRLTSSGDVGIGTPSPTQKLEVKSGNLLLSNAGTAGQLQLQGTGSGISTFKAGAQGSTTIDYTLPTTQGASSAVLTNDGNGNLSWAAAGASGWGLTGNAGTTYGTNFIGTTDAQDLQIRVQNVQAGVIEGSGNLNTGLGYQILTNNTLGGANVAIGYRALRANTEGGTNTAIGGEALMANTIGFNNTASGYDALRANTTGVSNTGIGVYALAYNTTGSDNTATGYYALGSNTGDMNTAAGYDALYHNTTGAWNTASGSWALLSNMTGSYNTAFGARADMADGLTNATAIGANAYVTQTNSLVLGSIANINGASGTADTKVGIGTTTPSQKLEVRDGALLLSNSGTAQQLQLQGTGSGISTFKAGAQVSTTINYTLPTSQPATNQVLAATAVSGSGPYAVTLGWAGSSGWGLTGNAGTIYGTNFIGTTDGQSLLFKVNGQKSGMIEFEGGSNTGMGYRVLAANITGDDNVAMGLYALNSNTNGGDNVAIGSQALTSNTEGVLNTAIGYIALAANLLGSSNTATGVSALGSNTNGSDNTAIGVAALSGNITGTENTAIGEAALMASTGDGNTATGEYALSNNGTGSWNTASGVQALVTNATGSFNTVFGAGADVGSDGLTNATAIGAMALVSADNSLVLGSIDGVNGATANTKVGIGTTAPNAPLEVMAASSGFWIPIVTVRSTGSQDPLAFQLGGTREAYLNADNTGNFTVGAQNAIAWETGGFGGANERMRIDNLGRVGINTSTPSEQLEVAGGNILISNSGLAGQLQLQGISTGTSTLQAGDQGSTTINYTLPTAQPATNDVLTATEISGSGPYAVTLGWASAGGSGPVFASNSSNQDYTGTSLHDVSGLGASVAASATYTFDGFIQISDPNNAGLNYKLAFTAPSGSTLQWGFIDPTATRTHTIVSGSGTETNNTFSTNPSAEMIRVTGILITSSNSGTLQLQDRKTSSGSDPLRVNANSYITLTRVQ